GDGTFTRITEGSLVNDGGNSTGSAWGDLDNDGDLDLFVGDDGGFNLLYVNNGEGTFTKITEGDLVNDAANTFGVSVEDYDADGDLDVYAANRLNQNNVLYANDGNDHNWLRVRAVGRQSNASAIGARVSVKATLNGTEVWQMREVTSQSGYNSQSSLGVAFGLANATVIDSLVIHWPSGMVDTFTDLAADQFLVATEGQTVSPVATEDQTPLAEQVFLGPNYPNPFLPETHIGFVLPEARFVTLKVYDVLGREVTTLVEGRRTAGPHEATFDGRGLPSGLYVYVLETDGVRRARPMLLIK
ncbi:MAG: ASPIC/UnbV domain-containing protein, partial [Bacteroidetes bacterium]|nr:ASPIC/UnbV domain-containing protein [Bacteroidota bacterium]